MKYFGNIQDRSDNSNLFLRSASVGVSEWRLFTIVNVSEQDDAISTLEVATYLFVLTTCQPEWGQVDAV
jgi:hypothetical protein